MLCYSDCPPPPGSGPAGFEYFSKFHPPLSADAASLLQPDSPTGSSSTFFSQKNLSFPDIDDTVYICKPGRQGGGGGTFSPWIEFQIVPGFEGERLGSFHIWLASLFDIVGKDCPGLIL